ncbi:hypothetical protein KKG83_06515 [Candidatus Micrarchaeota archaeon]|nr:hypothetical protein [Candidatus Micrarchaeota archaeon]MBU2477096.1 hypothetical protein [Candidatus Micrarchaeota archaeon]
MDLRKLSKALSVAHKRTSGEAFGFLQISGTGPDLSVSFEPMQLLHRTATNELKRFNKNPTVENLARYHDALEIFTASSPLAVNARKIATLLKQRISTTKRIRKLDTFMQKVDLNALRITKENAVHLASLSQKGGNKLIEFCGGAKFVFINGEWVVKPVYSNYKRFSRLSSILLQPFLKTSSQLIWHTHPALTKVGRPSHGDDIASKHTHIPILMAINTSNNVMSLEPKIVLTYQGKHYPVKII